MEDTETVYPFKDIGNVMAMQDGNQGIHRSALNVAHRVQAFHGAVINIDEVCHDLFPMLSPI